MTSRPEPLPHPASGGAHAAPGRPRLPATFPTTANSRQADAVIDLTVDAEKRLAEGSSAKTWSQRPTPRNFDSKPLSLAGLSPGPAAFPKFQAKGRPDLYFEDGSRGESGAFAGGVHGYAVKNVAGEPALLQSPSIPLPPRPAMSFKEEGLQNVPAASRCIPVKKLAKGGMEVPPEAMCFPQGKPVDFFPWNGNHPEDSLNETLVKTGFANKPQIMSETGTARVAVWTHLKNKSGLQTLSTLFIAMLEKRQNAGRLTAPSSFKPPPRVTLTDTKREAWLRDLANPAVALRRLSRTIPHGIRGKLLLEQCLSKNIPTARAVWLAKCVGANEMRAFKRKGATGNVGVGSEIKWIKEWTGFVEQFVESTIGACGQADWKTKMDYAIRLSSHLYNDHLLDPDHYLDWILTSFEGSPSERLPIWLLLVKIYWRDLTASRRRGSRLAEAILTHSRSFVDAVEDAGITRLRRNLDELAVVLLKAHRKCLLLPKSWTSHLPVVSSLLARYQKIDLQKELQHVQRQNERLVDGRALGANSKPSQEKEMLSMLDSVGHKVDVALLSSKCISMMEDPRQRIVYLLRWACSIYRCGDHRIYLALRLLRKWHYTGTDTDSIILEFLATSAQKRDCDPLSAFRIVADLVRSKTFSAGKYLQWLIATGALADTVNLSQAAECHLRLIAELPFESLPINVVNLRETLLRHTNQCEQETIAVQELQQRFTQDLQIAANTSQAYLESPRLLGMQGLGVKLAISRWLREQVFSHSAPADSPMVIEDRDEDSFVKPPPVNLAQFCLIRDALERAQDFPILADVLGLLLGTSDYSIFGAIADTLNYHSLVFAAIGALVPLLSQLTERYSVLRAEKLPDKAFLRAYIDLCGSVRVDPQLLQLLKYELHRIEQQTTVAVCSPASDNMADVLQSSNMDTDEDFDRILSSGSTMDEQMMGRMFKRLVARVSEESMKPATHSTLIVSWLPRLRAFDEKTFDRLVQEWVSGLILEQQLSLLRLAIPKLVVSGCFTLEGLVECSTKLLPVIARRQLDAATIMSREILSSMLPGDQLSPLCLPADAYRYRLMQSKCCSDPKNLLQLLRLALILARPNDGNAFNDVLTSESMIKILRPIVISSPKSLGDLTDQLSKVAPEAQAEKFTYLRSLFDALFDLSGRLNMGRLPLPQQVREMVGMADEFSLPFCRLEVQTILHQSKTLPNGEEEGVWRALSDAIKTLVDKNSPIWFELISGFSDGITRKIRENAEAQILAVVPTSLKTDPQALQRLGDIDEAALQRHLAVVSFAKPSIGQEGHPQILASIVERLKMLVEFLSSQDKASTPENKPAAMLTTEIKERICSWIEVLLRLAVIHKPYFQSGKATASHLAAFLVLLRSLLVSPELQQHLVTFEYVFDVAAYFSDDLTDDLRGQFSRLELNKGQFDPRTAFIFGATPSPDGWLGLISPQLSNTSSNAPQPTSQPSSQMANGPPSRTNSPITASPIGRPQTPQHRVMSQQKQAPPQQQRLLNQMQMQMQMQGQISPHQYQQQQYSTQFPFYQQQNQSPVQQNQAQPQQMPTPSATPASQPAQQAKQEPRPVPFSLRRWEILPDPASIAGGNDTALSLTLFGARKVM